MTKKLTVLILVLRYLWLILFSLVPSVKQMQKIRWCSCEEWIWIFFKFVTGTGTLVRYIRILHSNQIFVISTSTVPGTVRYCLLTLQFFFQNSNSIREKVPTVIIIRQSRSYVPSFWNYCRHYKNAFIAKKDKISKILFYS